MEIEKDSNMERRASAHHYQSDLEHSSSISLSKSVILSQSSHFRSQQQLQQPTNINSNSNLNGNNHATLNINQSSRQNNLLNNNNGNNHNNGIISIGNSNKHTNTNELNGGISDEDISTNSFLLNLANSINKLWVYISVLIFLIVMLTHATNYSRGNFDKEEFLMTLPIFRASGFLVLTSWCWSFVVLTMERFRINYVSVLKLDSRSTWSLQQLFRISLLMTIAWLAPFVALIYELEGNLLTLSYLPWRLYPLLTVLMMGVIVSFSVGANTIWKSWLLIVIGQSMAAPFFDVHFSHVFVTDFMCSMPKLFSDVEYTICFYLSGEWRDENVTQSTSWCAHSIEWVWPLTVILPLWFRFWQCIRRYFKTNKTEQLWNAGKYFSNLIAALIVARNPVFQLYSEMEFYRLMWFSITFGATLYSLYWDIVKDWGLTRSQLLFSPCTYYVAILIDFLLRFLWTHSMTRVLMGVERPYLVTLFGVVEIFRRTMWSVFRIEWEFLSIKNEDLKQSTIDV